MGLIIIRTIIIYVIVSVIFRLLGKREVGQIGTFDLVVFILIAELVAIALESKNNFYLHLVPVFIIVIIQIITSKLSLKSIKFRNMVDGKPTIIIKKGFIMFKNMIKQRYTLDDLLLQLREKDIRSIDEVDFAILETNGKLSVFKKKDKNKKVYPLPIITDGVIDYDNLKLINKNKNWIIKKLSDNSINLDDVFYAFYKKDNLYIINRKSIQ